MKKELQASLLTDKKYTREYIHHCV
jgi:hypothetical protein